MPLINKTARQKARAVFALCGGGQCPPHEYRQFIMSILSGYVMEWSTAEQGEPPESTVSIVTLYGGEKGRHYPLKLIEDMIEEHEDLRGNRRHIFTRNMAFVAESKGE